VQIWHAVVLQVGAQVFGAVPPKYLPVTQLLQSFTPSPMQLTQGEIQTGAHELGAVPPKYLPATQLLQSLAPSPTQLTQGATQG
jgi:hypothetical protein